MINFSDIKTWRDEFEQYAIKANLNTDKDINLNYTSIMTQELWNAWFNACISVMDKLIKGAKR